MAVVEAIRSLILQGLSKYLSEYEEVCKYSENGTSNISLTLQNTKDNGLVHFA